MKEFLKPCAYNPSEPPWWGDGVPIEKWVCESVVRGEANPWWGSRSEGESQKAF